VETRETERWQNGKAERTAANNSLLDFETLQKNKNLRWADCSGPKRPGMTS